VNAIKEALAGMESYSVTVCTADNFPASLNNYNVVVLHGLPSKRNNILPQVIASGKPVWYILTSQSAIAALNDPKNPSHTTITPNQPHDVLPSFNSSFNIFTVPPQVQSVINKMPPLLVSAGNVNAAPGSEALFNQKNGNGTMPLWIFQQGTTPTAILMGEGIWRWRLYEYKNFNDHSVIDECIRQTIAFLSAGNKEKTFSVNMPRYVWSDQQSIFMNAYLLNPNNEQVNTPDAIITITDSAGRKQNFSFERSGTAYSLNIGIWAGGTYTYAAHTAYNGKPCGRKPATRINAIRSRLSPALQPCKKIQWGVCTCYKYCITL
jgi:hypothetical protein